MMTKPDRSKCSTSQATTANTSFVGVVNALATAKAQFERERGGDACQMSMDRHRFRKRCERLTNGGNIHVLRVTCRHTRGAGFCAGLNVDAIFPAFEGAPLWPRRVFA